MLEINYIAVIAAAISYMIIGSLWYGPLFGKMWMGYMGLTKDSVRSMPLSVWQAMLGGLITALISAYVLAHFIGLGLAFYPDVTLFTAGWHTALWVWLGFVLTTQASSLLWEGKPAGLLVLNAAASLISYLVMAQIIVLWPL